MHVEHFVGLDGADVVGSFCFAFFGDSLCFKEDAEERFIFTMIAMRRQKSFIHDRADDVDVGIRKRTFAILAWDCFLDLLDDLFEFVEIHAISVAKKRIFSRKIHLRSR